MKKGWGLDIFISPRSCLATAFFLTGFFFKQNESCFNKWKVSYVIISSLVLYGALYLRRVSMGSLTMWYDIPYYYLLGVIGTWMVVQLSRCILKIMSKGIVAIIAFSALKTDTLGQMTEAFIERTEQKADGEPEVSIGLILFLPLLDNHRR